MKNQEQIIIKGAAQNNLKNVDIDIPKNKLVVVTGVSGSGKSSLAFDTLYAEGYRRYVENLSSSARFFLGSVKKPQVKRIDNLSPAIAIDQKSDSSNPRSTVGTTTDIYNFLRILFANAGQPHCPKCGGKMVKQDEKELIDKLRRMENGTQVMILALWRGAQKTNKEKLSAIAQQGYSKVRIAEKKYSIDEAKKAKLSGKEKTYVVVDRLTLLANRFDRERIVDSLQVATKLSGGEALALIDNEEKLRYSRYYQCEKCHLVLKKITAKNFSFNSPEGACQSCSGLGEVFQMDPKKTIPNRKLSINEGAIMPWSRAGGRLNGGSKHEQLLKALSKKYRFSLNTSIQKIPEEKVDKILFGTGEEEISVKNGSQKVEKIKFEGLAQELEEKYLNADSSFVRNEIGKYLSKKKCPKCEGKRLQKPFLHVKILDKTIDKIVEMELDKLIPFLQQETNTLKKGRESKKKKAIVEIIDEIISRLGPLQDVGLDYLNLDRSVQTLSGGEFQRVRLATQLYSGLSDVIYVLDEPSVGLHPKDTKKLISTLRKLKQSGNSIVVVEHDRDIIKAADHVIDVGPGAGKEGGKITFSGSVAKMKKSKTQTAKYLSGRKKIARKKKQNKKIADLIIRKAKHNNLKNIDVKVPLGKLVSVVGVSGSGKSSLVNDVLAKALRREIHNHSEDPGEHSKIENTKKVSKVVIVDQASIGRSPRSNAATYTGIFSHIRKLFASTEAAQKKRFTASHFSFNMRGGRCEYCQGEGMRKIDMHLLDNMYVDCPHCNGTRYNRKMLAVEYHGANIVDVLNMSVDYAYHFFNSHRLIKEKLGALRKVGLGYLRLGQNATELSGGEAQRIKLATELSRKSNGNTLYILDEPTVGLHFSDVDQLLNVLRDLVNGGNSVVLVEHNSDLVKQSDWVVELGPEGGEEGGEVVFEGTPEKLKTSKTWTAKHL